MNDEAGYRLAAGASWLDTFYSVLFALFWDVLVGFSVLFRFWGSFEPF